MQLHNNCNFPILQKQSFCGTSQNRRFCKEAFAAGKRLMPSPKQPITIVFDTNILVAIEQKKADVFSMARHLFGEKVQFAVTSQVLDELNELQGSGKTMAKAVKIALTTMHKEKTGEIRVEARNADDSLVEAAEQGYCIASNDKALRKRIKGFGVAIMYLSKEKLLKIA